MILALQRLQDIVLVQRDVCWQLRRWRKLRAGYVVAVDLACSWHDPRDVDWPDTGSSRKVCYAEIWFAEWGGIGGVDEEAECLGEDAVLFVQSGSVSSGRTLVRSIFLVFGKFT